jgi:hypothetical protein
MSFRIQGDQGLLAEVTPNQEIQVRPTLTAANAGYVKLADNNGNGLLFGNAGQVDLSSEYLLFSQGNDWGATYLFYQRFIATVSTFTITALTYNISQGPGFIQLNGGAATNVSSSALLTSQQQFSIIPDGPLWFRTRVHIINSAQINQTVELGFGYNNKSTFVDGACFRWKTDNTFSCVTSNASTEQTSGTLANPTDNQAHDFAIRLDTGAAYFYVDDVLVATIIKTNTLACISGTCRLGIFFRVATDNPGPTLAPILRVGAISVSQQGYRYMRPYGATMSMLNNTLHSNFPGDSAQTANHANSTNPVSASLSNTAAGYTTLGGRYQFAAPLGAATDFALFYYTVPVYGNLVITGIRITAMNTGAIVGTTATILDWSISCTATQVSLAVADTLASGTFTARRMTLGVQGFPVNSPIGFSAPDIYLDLSAAPLYIGQRVGSAARGIHIIVQVPVGTATASQVIRGDVTFSGYWDRLY